MSVFINTRLIRLGLGCIQPASAEDVSKFLAQTLGTEGAPIPPESIQSIFDDWASQQDVVCVHQRQHLYSLTRKGDNALDLRERRLRDKTRLFLIKELRAATLKRPEAEEPEKADDSSAVAIDSATQGERPKGAAANPRAAPGVGRAFWPLLSKQLFVGSSPQASGLRFRFFSFPSILDCCKAAGGTSIPEDGVGVNEISLALGISPSLLKSFLARPEHHYRVFEIPKANGKMRQINAPRTMLKVLQYFFVDYLLDRLAVHPAATAYWRGSSVRKNAERHARQRYVANIDVTNFFPSLSTGFVIRSLCAAGLKPDTAALVARLSSYKGGLPQGAPTSAALSNIVMYGFDKKLSEACASLGVNYTRYADDMTFSGLELGAIQQSIKLANESLAEIRLKINDEKTRIYGPSTRQVVTGVVVNDWPQPSRVERRRLRAELHHAKLSPATFVAKYQQLQGRAAYVLSYAGEERPVGALSRGYVEEALFDVRRLHRLMSQTGGA
ncbi:MAG: hypothetical protein DCF26_19035 [Burkholderiales bacterium]|nr:MAG: hypothetical protein DCF26_19035 [Burkholderiales bacterium]